MLRMKFYEGMYSQKWLAFINANFCLILHCAVKFEAGEEDRIVYESLYWNLPLALSLQISIKQGVFILLLFDNDLQGNDSSCPLWKSFRHFTSNLMSSDLQKGHL